ncbi:hypothetical protein [Cryobacterium sp. Y11]|nr:hypothetical protein [Cryobacterium sp. Y11]
MAKFSRTQRRIFVLSRPLTGLIALSGCAATGITASDDYGDTRRSLAG